MRKLLLAIIAILAIATCAAFIALGYFFITTTNPALGTAPTTAHVVINTNATPMPAVKPRVMPIQVPVSTATVIPATASAQTNTLSETSNTLDLLTHITYPPNDRVLLAEEYKGAAVSLATPGAPKNYKVGDKETFWVSRDVTTSERKQIQATLRYMNSAAYMWVEDGIKISDAALKNAADNFANKIYPTNRKYLGSESNPGIDNDPRIHILNAEINGGVSGYFAAYDTLPRSVYAQSNEHEMVYTSANTLKPGNTVYDSVLAHEFAHMIHDYQNRRGDATWITEGFGELGMELNGYPTGTEFSYTENPDLQLNAWGDAPGESLGHYGQAYLFLSYLLNRYGIDFIRDLISTDTTGIATIQRALDLHKTGLSFDQVFGDWVAANFITSETQDPRFHYRNESLQIRPTVGYSQYPANGDDTVNQYGADYIQLLPNGKDITFTFDGADTVRILPTDAAQGKYFWWSGHTDSSDARLTRQVDLTGVLKATLKFSTWYEIEDSYDYAYVSVSADDGKHWQTLQGTTTTTVDPNGHSYGYAFNCRSGVGCGDAQGTAKWVQEEMDLTPFAGKKILLRFEQITDEALTKNGFAIDEIEIPEIGFRDDAESVDSGWNAEGFARIENVLPQRFIVQAIEYGATPRVVPIALDAQNRATYTTRGFGSEISRVVITVSGSTPVTYQPTEYQYQIQ
ncbi:MAG: hypothetical protein EYC68_00670 [Chloroflexota bacterium]|nr:MAG: hypothetical protein EYC68_00670 [Chloroflexota bacterium]